MCMWQKEIERVKNDSSYTEQQKKNVIAYYELQIRIKGYELEAKEKRRLKARALILLKRQVKLKEKLEATEKEFSEIFYDDKLFFYSERTRFEIKHEELFRNLRD